MRLVILTPSVSGVTRHLQSMADRSCPLWRSEAVRPACAAKLLKIGWSGLEEEGPSRQPACGLATLPTSPLPPLCRTHPNELCLRPEIPVAGFDAGGGLSIGYHRCVWRTVGCAGLYLSSRREETGDSGPQLILSGAEVEIGFMAAPETEPCRWPPARIAKPTLEKSPSRKRGKKAKKASQRPLFAGQDPAHTAPTDPRALQFQGSAQNPIFSDGGTGPKKSPTGNRAGPELQERNQKRENPPRKKGTGAAAPRAKGPGSG